MKKRIVRIVVYFSLLILTLAVLSHPYVRQSVFGPKIKGEPLWAWQQEFRSHGDNLGPPTLLNRLLALLNIESRPMPVMGYFPWGDPDMLPVLYSLENDLDIRVRANVASALGATPPTSATLAALIRMLDDPSADVQESVLWCLISLKTAGEPALPKLREMLPDATPEIHSRAAVAMIHIGPATPEVRAVLRDSLMSNLRSVRSFTASGLNAMVSDDEQIFAILIDRARNDPYHDVRHFNIGALQLFGKKAVPPLIGLVRNPVHQSDIGSAISALGQIGTEPKDDDLIFTVLMDRVRNDGYDNSRHSSIFALCNFGKKAVPPLVGLLLNPAHKTDTRHVIFALGRIGPDAKDAIPALERFRDDPDLDIRMVTERTLMQIDPRRAGK